MRRMKAKVAKLVVYLIHLAVTVMMLGLLTNCTRIVPGENTVHTKEVIKKDSLVYLPSAQVEQSVSLDSVGQLQIGHWYTFSDSLNKVQLKYMRDQMNRLRIKAERPPDTIKVENNYTFEKEITTRTVTQTENKVPFWYWLILGASTPFAAIGIFRVIKV